MASGADPTKGMEEVPITDMAGQNYADDDDVDVEKFVDEKEVQPVEQAKGWKNCFGLRKQGTSSEPKKEEEKHVRPSSFFKLFQYTSVTDRFLIAIGLVFGAIHGALLPAFTVLFGDLVDVFGGAGDVLDSETAMEAIRITCLRFFYLALGAFATGAVQVYFLMVISQKQARKIRNLCVRGLLSQELAWYDEVDSAELASRVSADVQKIEDGTGDKVSSCAQFLAQFIAGFVVGFIYGWKLTLVILAIAPLLALSGMLFGKMSADAVSDAQTSYAKAGSVAEEAFSMIRIVASYNLETIVTGKYIESLKSSLRAGCRKALWTGVGLGLTMFVVLASYGLAFWFGNKLSREGEMEAGRVLTVFFSVIIGAFAIGQAAPSMSAIAEARGAAPKIFDIIQRKSEIDAFSREGETAHVVKGALELKDVDFTYRNREDRLVLNKLNLTIDPGTTVALVGESGCGKSTTIQLLERFYDPRGGSVFLDGKNLRDYNVQWLRGQMGFVAQMPVLFALSIRENIALGAGVDENFEKIPVTQEDIENAAKMANAHDFIKTLPEGYDTVLGERGAQLSGGQKQRIAIARALVRDPKILLLDEATSALDTNSERIVQEAIDRAQEGRTVVVIAHRLSTIRKADKIVVFAAGQIKEQGTHEELIKIEGGIYRNLVNLQSVSALQDQEETNGETTREAWSKHTTKKSHGDTIEDNKAGDEVEEEGSKRNVDKGIVWRTLKLSRPEWGYIFFGVLSAIVTGLVWPAFAVIFSNVLKVLTDPNAPTSTVNLWSAMFVLVAAISAASNLGMMALTGIAGELLTNRLRIMTFKSLIRKDIGFFDHRENSVGILTARLATEASKVRGVVGDRLASFLSMIATMVAAIIISFIACPKLAAVVLATVPLFALAGALQFKMLSGFSGTLSKLLAGANGIAMESVMSIHTVTALGAGEQFLKDYDEQLVIPAQKGRRKAAVAGFAFGLSEFAMFGIWGLSFWYGSKLAEPRNGERPQCDFEDVTRALSALLFAAMNLGQMAAMLPDAAEAGVAATKIFRLVDSESAIDPLSESGEKIESYKGLVKYDDIVFRYPARPEVTVLKGLHALAQPGTVLALVGPSGSGKSTLALLIERFYDPQGGFVSVDDKNIKDVNLSHHRSQVGFVTQEPELFSTTIRENIEYGFGKIDGTVVTEEQVVNAAKVANAHNFIMKLPMGYETDVGAFGRELSGGQRQRIAIARAVVRDPSILVLDEATSALDSESETHVQEALNQASKGRTTIVIAHRLSTIRHADIIAVVSEGKIRESGTHNELMAKSNGLYAGLVAQQTL